MSNSGVNILGSINRNLNGHENTQGTIENYVYEEPAAAPGKFYWGLRESWGKMWMGFMDNCHII